MPRRPAPTMFIERRRDRPGGRFRLFPSGPSEEPWRVLAPKLRTGQRGYVPKASIDEDAIEALRQLGVVVEITEAAE